MDARSVKKAVAASVVTSFFFQNKSDTTNILRKYICGLKVFPLDDVKHISSYSWKISPRECFHDLFMFVHSQEFFLYSPL